MASAEYSFDASSAARENNVSSSVTKIDVTDAIWKCGYYNTKMECDNFALGLCHSGTNPECSNSHGCGGKTYAAVQCSGDSTDVKKGASHWQFGSYGQHLSCASTTGSAATGACGGGMNPDCASGAYFGVDCSDNNVKVIEATCEWTYHGYGTYFSCPSERPILAGSCSGGANPDCNGQYFATQCCSEHAGVKQVTGQWQAGRYSSGPQTITYSRGTTISHSTSTTATIGSEISTSVEAGCEVLGVGGKATISSKISSSLATMDQDSFTQTKSSSYSTTVPAGQVWQWIYDSELTRGSATTLGQAIVSTKGTYDPPCCVPGQFADPKNPTGACHEGSPNLCTQKVFV